MFVMGVRSMLIQSQTNEVGIGSKLHELFGVNAFKNVSSDMIHRETNSYL